MRVLFAGGGTGGHLVPGMALAHEVRARGGDTLFVTAGRPIESALLREERFVSLPLETGSGALGPAAVALRLPGAVRDARRLLRSFRPDVVVGLGGLASFPVSLASRWERIPVVLLEINAVPGRATRWLAPLARRVLVAGDDAARVLGARALVTGTPLRAGFERLPDRREARAALGFEAERPLLLVLGGSQGASSLNRAVAGCLERFEADSIQLLWLTGPGKDGEARRACASRSRLRARVLPYLEEAAAAFAAADLAVCRSGAGTVSELAAAGLPAIAVPYPHHRDHQQLRNAARLGEGALVVEDADLTPARLASEVGELLADPARRARMAESCRRSARPRAASEALEALVETVAREGRGQGGADAYDGTAPRGSGPPSSPREDLRTHAAPPIEPHR